LASDFPYKTIAANSKLWVVKRKKPATSATDKRAKPVGKRTKAPPLAVTERMQVDDLQEVPALKWADAPAHGPDLCSFLGNRGQLLSQLWNGRASSTSVQSFAGDCIYWAVVSDLKTVAMPALQLLAIFKLNEVGSPSFVTLH